MEKLHSELTNQVTNIARNWSQKSYISQIWLNIFDSVLFNAMATLRMIL